jgi:hypothetical protein
MKLGVPFVFLLVGCAASPERAYSIDQEEVVSGTDADSDFAREVQAHKQAMARLPAMDAHRVELIVRVLSNTKFPTEASVLVDALGGEDALVWKRGVSGYEDDYTWTRSVLAVSRPDAAGGTYAIILSYMRRPAERPSSMVTAARFYYASPHGRWFRVESVNHPLFDFEEEEANKTHQHNAGDRPSAKDSPASHTPSSPAPRG